MSDIKTRKWNILNDWVLLYQTDLPTIVIYRIKNLLILQYILITNIEIWNIRGSQDVFIIGKALIVFRLYKLLLELYKEMISYSVLPFDLKMTQVAKFVKNNHIRKFSYYNRILVQ